MAILPKSVLAKRRSNFHGNQFPVTTEVARKAAVMPVRNRRINQNGPRFTAMSIQRKVPDSSFNAKNKAVATQRPQTLDALFANMKEQRMRLMSQKVNRENGLQITQRRNAPRQQQGRVGARGGPRRQLGNYVKRG